jgi:glycoside/pentoside/hexuronide:cation symporter, GPH family
MQAIPPVSLFRKLMYALGQTGWALASFGVTQLLVFFYLPPDTGTQMFETYIQPKSVLGIFTIVGLIGSLGYLFSSLMEPIIANWSERSRFSFGRRRTFMAIAAAPFALFSILIFMPLKEGIHPGNVAWLTGCILFLYFFMTMYVTPFNAYINELTRNDKERLQLVMIISVAFALGYGLGNSVHFFLSVAEKYMSTEQAFRTIIGGYGMLAFVLMMLPVIFINEDKHCDRIIPNAFKMREMLRQVFRNRNFRIYSVVELIAWLPQTMFMLATPYFVTVLMKMEKENSTFIIIIVGAFSFAWYGVIGKLVKRFGNKKILISGFGMFMVSLIFISTLGKFTMPVWALTGIFVLLTAYPLAVFGIIPMALTGDIAEEDGKETGIVKNAAFFGMKSFMMKIGVALSQLIFPSLLLLGNTRDDDMGVRMVAIFCAIACLVGMMQMSRFNDLEPDESMRVSNKDKEYDRKVTDQGIELVKMKPNKKRIAIKIILFLISVIIIIFLNLALEILYNKIEIAISPFFTFLLPIIIIFFIIFKFEKLFNR